MAKLTLNYAHCTDEESEARKEQLVPATQTRKLLSQVLNLTSGFRMHICSLCYAGGGNLRT